MRLRTALAGAVQALGIAASAAVVPVSPTDGAKVALLPEAQKKIMSFATHEERVAAVKADFDEGLAKYGDADTPLSRRIELYLLECGVTQDEIDRFRSIMLDSGCAYEQ